MEERYCSGLRCLNRRNALPYYQYHDSTLRLNWALPFCAPPFHSLINGLAVLLPATCRPRFRPIPPEYMLARVCCNLVARGTDETKEHTKRCDTYSRVNETKALRRKHLSKVKREEVCITI